MPIWALLPRVHQFVRIGSYSFLGSCNQNRTGYSTLYVRDWYSGKSRLGLNLVGLKRRGGRLELMQALKHVYQLFYRRDLKLTEIRQELEQMSQRHPEINLFLDIMDNTKRGIARPRCIDRPNCLRSRLIKTYCQ